MESEDGVTGVHDIHAWTITTGYDFLNAHVTLDLAAVNDPDSLLQHLRQIASKEFGIAHVTIQIEEVFEICEEVHHIAHLSSTSLSGGTGGAGPSRTARDWTSTTHR